MRGLLFHAAQVGTVPEAGAGQKGATKGAREHFVESVDLGNNQGGGFLFSCTTYQRERCASLCLIPNGRKGAMAAENLRI